MSGDRVVSSRSGRHAILAITALGVVYGDIGTSPLYALRECFHGPHAVAPTPANVLGVLSLVFWSLIIVVSVKYLVFILRADNRGEGGILALMALLLPGRITPEGRLKLVVAPALFGAALLYGDSMITPAISVLSAVEGLELATPIFKPFVIPIALGILVALFAVQRHGSARVGSIFGPIMLAWFSVLGLLGVSGILRHPEVLRSIDPTQALSFFAHNGMHAFLILAAVVLVVTGGEALYADMGHFGKRAIRLGWFTVVLPALLLNYFGQGALLLADPSAARNPFYLLAPGWALYPLVALSAAAAVIASQAVISGAFSLSRQAVQLGYSPRLRIEHTSSDEIGQIYVPQINWVLLLATAGLVLEFRSSSALAGAYGVAVTGTMVATTLLFCIVARRRWRWGLGVVVALGSGFLAVDLGFFAATLTKIHHGGWFPLVVACAMFAVMTTWKKGRAILAERLEQADEPIETFLTRVLRSSPVRVPGTAIYLSSSSSGTPPALIQNLKHNKVLHERIGLMTLVTREIPRVPIGERLQVKDLGHGFYRLVAEYGFMEDPHVPHVLHLAADQDFPCRLEQTTFFLGSETVLPTHRPGMAIWRERLFAFMARNAQQATLYFRLPADRVVVVGTQIEI